MDGWNVWNMLSARLLVRMEPKNDVFFLYLPAPFDIQQLQGTPGALRMLLVETKRQSMDLLPLCTIIFYYIFKYPCRLVNDWPYQWSLVPVYHSSLTVFRRQSWKGKRSFFSSDGYSRKPPKLGTRRSLSINCVLITNETKHPYLLYHEKMRMGPNIQGCSV